MKLPRILRNETTPVLSDEQIEQVSALSKSGGNPQELIARAALGRSWEANGRARAEKLAHDRGVQDGTITELFPSQSESDQILPEPGIETLSPRMRHVKIILPHMVKVELFDQDSDIV